jgi:hypothetical protein
MAVQDEDLKQAHNLLQEGAVCTWVQDRDWDNPSDYYTTCGQSFSLVEGTPKENGFNYCCYCGQKLIENLAEGDEDDS